MSVGSIRISVIDSILQRFIEKELTDMRDGATRVSSIIPDSAVLLSNQMDMSCSSGVMSGEDGVEVTDALTVHFGYTTKEGGVL